MRSKITAVLFLALGFLAKTTVAQVTASISTNSTTICSGAGSTFTAVPSGGTPPYTYSWAPGTGLSSTTTSITTASPTVTTVYTVTITDQLVTSGTATVQLTVNPTPTLSISGSTTICSGGNTILTGSGASAYTWTPGGITSSSYNVSPGSTTTYTLAGATGACTSTKTVTVLVNPTPTISVNSNSPVCEGQTINLTSSTGASSPSYTWTGPSSFTGYSSTANIGAAPSTAGVYTLNVLDIPTGCSNTATINVVVNPQPTVSVNSISICAGSSGTLTASGAVSYNWAPSSGLSSTFGTTVTASPLSTTVYTVTGTSASGCTNIGAVTATVTVNALPVVTVNSATICSGSFATLTATGASTYNWAPAGTLSSSTGYSVVATPPVTTSYTITGTSAAGCVGTGTTAVVVNASPSISVNSAAICFGGNTVLVASGASTYSWSPSGSLSASSGSSVTANPGASTIYTVTGSNGSCSSNATSTVTVYANPSVSISGASTMCSGSSTTFTASGAATYAWSGSNLSAPTSAITNASPPSTSTYTVDGTDANGCVGSATLTLTVLPLPPLTMAGTDLACNGVCTGKDSAVSATAISYTWSPGGQNTAAISSLCPGTYTVYVSDANGCMSTMSNVINQPTILTVGFTNIVDASCPGVSNGSADGVPTGGVAPYTYLWSGGSTSATTSGLQAGVYSLTVTDNNGCVSSGTVNITNIGSGPSAALSYPTTLCQGQQGQLTYTATGGNPPYTPLWKDVVTATTLSTTDTAMVTPLVSGSYTVALWLNDQAGCSSHDSAFISVGVADSLSGTVVDTSLNPVTAGEVYLFQQKTINVGLLDTAGYTNIVNGAYTFPNALYGDYFVKVIADTNVYTASIATYYSNRSYPFQWDSALVINHYTCNASNASGYNVKILEVPALTGPGQISGLVTEGPGYGHRYIGGGIAPMGAPLKGVDVKLGRNPGGSPAARTMTDTSGKYAFNNIPLNVAFTIYVDIPNYGMDSTLTVTLTSTTTTSNNNNYYVDSVMVRVNDSASVGIPAIKAVKDQMILYPNPSSGALQYDLATTAPQTSFEVWITDLSGKEVLRNASTANSNKQIDARNLPTGTYIVHIRTESGVISKKIVIQR